MLQEELNIGLEEYKNGQVKLGCIWWQIFNLLRLIPEKKTSHYEVKHPERHKDDLEKQ